MVEILENATVVYIDGVKERFDAIQLTEDKAITGRLFITNGKEKFMQNGFISRRNIKKIYNGTRRNVEKIKVSC
jgi:hypothetical protein